jgi:hypothetical protein
VPVLVVALRDLLLVLATYFGFRDLWVSTVEGPFLPPRLRALVSRGGASADAAAVQPATPVAAKAAQGQEQDGDGADEDAVVPAGAESGSGPEAGSEEKSEQVEAAK